jgi:hypothetical protein
MGMRTVLFADESTALAELAGLAGLAGARDPAM